MDRKVKIVGFAIFILLLALLEFCIVFAQESYLKNETYNSTEIDSKIEELLNLIQELKNSTYNKTELYNTTEINSRTALLNNSFINRSEMDTLNSSMHNEIQTLENQIDDRFGNLKNDMALTYVNKDNLTEFINSTEYKIASVVTLIPQVDPKLPWTVVLIGMFGIILYALTQKPKMFTPLKRMLVKGTMGTIDDEIISSAVTTKKESIASLQRKVVLMPELSKEEKLVLLNKIEVGEIRTSLELDEEIESLKMIKEFKNETKKELPGPRKGDRRGKKSPRRKA